MAKYPNAWVTPTPTLCPTKCLKLRPVQMHTPAHCKKSTSSWRWQRQPVRQILPNRRPARYRRQPQVHQKPRPRHQPRSTRPPLGHHPQNPQQRRLVKQLASRPRALRPHQQLRRRLQRLPSPGQSHGHHLPAPYRWRSQIGSQPPQTKRHPRQHQPRTTVVWSTHRRSVAGVVELLGHGCGAMATRRSGLATQRQKDGKTCLKPLCFLIT